MALYWPEEKVALDIVDDPYRRPFEGDESYTVLRVTTADLCDYDSYRKVMERLCDLLGREMPTMPDWEEKNRALHALVCEETESDLSEACYPFPDFFGDDCPSNIEILATSEDEAAYMKDLAQANGRHVRGVSVWDGPIPDGSFETISGTTRMSTPEYFFLRKSNQLPFAKAIMMGMELCGKYRTLLTQFNRDEGYDLIKTPRTTKDVIKHYLSDIRNTKEGKRARRILRYVEDECSSPMSAYLYLLLCLPRARGSYGLGRAMPSAAFRLGEGFMPGSNGDFLAYDVCWPKKLVAAQYIGDQLLSTRNYEALKVGGVRVVCFGDEDVADPDRFDRLAHKLADLLDISLPETTKSWLEARDKLRHQAEVPDFDHMLLTMHDMTKHKSW